MEREKTDILDFILILLIYAKLVILEFFGLGALANRTIMVLILLRVVLWKKKQWRKGIAIGAIVVLLFFLSVIRGETFDLSACSYNLRVLLYPAAYTYCLVTLAQNKPKFLDRVMAGAFPVINATIVINIIVMLIQIYFPYSVNAVIVDEQYIISYYKDLISGLFAYATTQVVCVFTVAVIIYDLGFIKRMKTKEKKYLLIAYILLITVASLYISTLNDNKAFFLLLPICLVLYWLTEDKDLKDLWRYSLKGALIIGGALIVCILLSPDLRGFIYTHYIHMFQVIIRDIDLGPAAHGGNVRIGILKYALLMKSTWLTGTGLGTTSVYTRGYLGFDHFGQSDMGNFLTIGGIWFTLFIAMWYVSGFSLLSGARDNLRPKALIAAIAAITALLMIYSQCFSNINMACACLLLMLSLRIRGIKGGET